MILLNKDEDAKHSICIVIVKHLNTTSISIFDTNPSNIYHFFNILIYNDGFWAHSLQYG